MTRQEDEGIVSGYKSLHKSSRQLPGGSVSFGYIERMEEHMTYAQESAQRRTLSSAQHAHDNAVPDFTDPSVEWWEEQGEQVMADIGAALDSVPGLAESDASKIYDAVDKMLFAHREDIAKAIGGSEDE